MIDNVNAQQRITTESLQKFKMNALKWSPQSPDLNSIDIPWFHFKTHVNER